MTLVPVIQLARLCHLDVPVSAVPTAKINLRCHALDLLPCLKLMRHRLHMAATY